MILLCGLPSEPPLMRVRECLVELGASVVMFDQRGFAQVDLDIVQHGPETGGSLRIGAARHELAAFSGAYVRAFAEQSLPEFQALSPDAPERARCADLFARFHAWCEVTDARVVNRMSVMGSNASKPYQAERIRRSGFSIPATLITNDPEEVLAFRAEHERVIFKSLSGVRSIVTELDEHALERLDNIRWCPVQFQELVEGCDVRVHVVGAEVFPTEIESTAIDYRYASRRPDGRTRLRPHKLDNEIAARCVALADSLGLPVCGIDLRVARDGRIVCFEVNPSPGFSYYESSTGQPIAMAIARYLTSR